MSNQVQCPNCGGYRVETVNKADNKVTNREHTDFWFYILIGGGISLAAAIIFVWGIYDSFHRWRSHPVIAAEVVIPIVLTLIGLLAMNAGWRHSKADQKNLILHYYHTCWLCGYRWNRRADEPLPEVRIRPDLIAKGEQRLQEEARQAEIEHHVAQDILNRKP